MSLQVWLPLTKDLRQQGLSNITITNSGATYSATGGKLGGCYVFDGSDDSIGIGNLSTLVNTDFTFACWFYKDEWGSKGYETIFGGPSGFELESKVSSTNSPVLKLYNWGGGSCTYELSKWNHIVFTRNSTETKLYLNGELKVTGSAGTIPNNNYFVGSWNSATQQNFKGKMCDVRIYDHCLSPMEVKELAKGLVLHYPLTDAYVEETTNLVTGLTAGGQTIIDGNTVKTKGESNADTYFYIKTPALTSGTTYTLSCYVSGLENGKFWSFGIGAQSGANKCCSFVLYNGYNNCTFTLPSGLANATQLIWDDDNYSVARATTIMQVSNIQLERKDHATGYAGIGNTRTPTTVYDCSGFVNNGVPITTTMSVSSDTAKYLYSTHFNGTYDGILIENLQLSDIINSAVTYAFWIKPENESGARSVYFGSYSTGPSWSIEKTAGNVIRSYWNGSPDETCNGATITDGVWQHVCLTKSGTNDIKVYINGVQKWASTATHSNLNFPTTFRIGRDTRSNDGTPYKGLMSDFRIYATALSTDDVKSLYQNEAYIDSSGTIYGQIR